MAWKRLGGMVRELLLRAPAASGVVPALGGLADAVASSIQGITALAGAVGAVLVAVGATIRFLPGTSADLRQTATRMIEGGVILLAIVGTGALILGGANWLGQQLAGSVGAEQGATPPNMNPWR
jgi:hypothetical protein